MAKAAATVAALLLLLLSSSVSCATWPKIKTINGMEVLWEVPALVPSAILFVAHGCAHAGSDFWSQSDACQHCLGLPEEVMLRQIALKRGFAVIAASSFDRNHTCWDNTGFSEDLRRLPGALREVMEEEQLQELPLFAFGASSGGGFVQKLATVMPEVHGVTAEIAPMDPSLVEPSFPPIMFVHMIRGSPDKQQETEALLKAFRAAGVPAEAIFLLPQPVSSSLLMRSSQINPQLAGAIQEALKEGGFLDEEGYLLEDPRETTEQWQKALEPVVGPGISLRPDASPVSELLNVAYAHHELTSEAAHVWLSWMEGQGDKSVADIVAGCREAGRCPSLEIKIV